MNKRVYFNCSVFGCLNTTQNCDYTFFKFPNDIERRAVWLKLIDREDLIDKPANHCRVCEVHFDSDSFLKSANRMVLKKNTVPKHFLPNKKYESKETQTIAVKSEDTESQCTPYVATCGSQTPAYLLKDTPEKRKIQNELVECRKKLRKATTGSNANPFMFHTLCDKFLSKNLSEIVKEHTKLKFNSSGNRYSANYKIFCLNLFYTSPQAYNLLKDTFCMPSKTALKRMNMHINTKVDSQIMEVLKRKVDQMTDMERNCSLVIDALSLKAKLINNTKKEIVYGFHEIDGVQSRELAKYAVVAMIHGIFDNYKQPVGYALLAESTNYENVSKWIDKLIEKLFEIGLNVRVVVSNMGSEFLNSAKKRLVSTERPYFFVDNKKIYYIFDAPHLIKMVRNNLMNYNLHFDNCVAKWEHILQFYQQDKTKQLRIATKLTESHVKPNKIEKTKVKLAVQVLSATVAAGISTYKDFGAIDESAEGTIKLITMMNNLFDMLNSSIRIGSTKYQNAFCGDEYQISFINEMLNFFATLKLINPKNGKDATSKLKFVEGFQITLKSILLLFEDLRVEGYTHIQTRHLNQDCLEKFFNRVRSINGKCAEPTSRHLVSVFQKAFYTNVLKRTKEGNSKDITVPNGKTFNPKVAVKLEPQEPLQNDAVMKEKVEGETFNPNVPVKVEPQDPLQNDVVLKEEVQ